MTKWIKWLETTHFQPRPYKVACHSREAGLEVGSKYPSYPLGGKRKEEPAYGHKALLG